ncbi:MAG: ABC transporter permease [Coriobacteriales bacterium]|jgi:NitT/TauT family transport system permease protein|nr:ABC transporter permease [Coriobacteriales bacterium]
MAASSRHRPVSLTALSLIAFLVVMALWLLLSYGVGVSHVFLPPPHTVVMALVGMFNDGTLVGYTALSTWRVLVGWGLSVIVALPLGMLIATSPVARALVQPLTEFARYLPVVALVPLTLLYCGIGEEQKYAIIFLGTFFQLLLMVADSVGSVDRTLLNSAATLGAGRRQRYLRVLLPAALPSLLDDLRITVGWAWTYLVVAEMVAANAGLGYLVLKSQRFLATDAIFAGLIVIGLVGLVTDRLFQLITRLAVPWHEKLGDARG